MELKNLFFSYSRADGSDFALRLAVDLQQQGFNVWIDQQDIRAGSEWDLEIEKALETCDCLLFIESPKSVISTNVLDEVYYALEQNKRVIPLVLLDSKTPFRLKRLQHINFSTGYDKGLTQLIGQLKAGNGHPADAPIAVNASTENPHHAVSQKKNVVIGIIALILILLVGTLAYFSNNETKEPEIGEAGVPVTVKDTRQPPGDTSAAVPVAAGNTILADTNQGIQPTARRLPGDQSKASKSQRVADQPRLTPTPKQLADKAVETPSFTTDDFVGSWELAGVTAPARAHRGYLNIETASDNRLKILSGFQFNFIKANDTAYFEVFNGFAGCASCKFEQEIPLTDTDIAFGGQIYKILRADVEGEGKRGDTVMMIGPNKSINAKVVLHLPDKNSAIIKVSRSTTVPMSYGMVIPPFDYTFRFKRKGS